MGIPAKDSDENMRAFVERHGLDGMIQVVDDDGAIWTRYGVGFQPAWVLVDRAGEMEVVAGPLDRALEERLGALAGR